MVGGSVLSALRFGLLVGSVCSSVASVVSFGLLIGLIFSDDFTSENKK
jgi:hypothetical protein